MIKVAVCDDENIIACQIEDIILNISKKECIVIDVDVFYSGQELEREVRAGENYDLIYLDIQMEGGDGITAAKNIREIDENVLLIFVSGYDKYMMELFRLDVFAFVRKPIDQKAFVQLFHEANLKICNRNFYFVFRYNSAEYKIPYKDILYFESNGRQITLYMRSGDTKIFNEKLSEVETKIYESKIPFLRIHQSYLVNYHLIRSRSKSEVTLINGKKLPISEDRRKEFMKEYGKLLGGEISV